MTSPTLRTFALAAVLAFAGPSFAGIYYVSPAGNDTNPGTESQPWKTARKAAQTAAAGDIVIFEDGTYNETLATKFSNTGTAANPIVFKARNRHQAVLNYVNRLNQEKLKIESGREYITIQDFEITQEADRTQGSSSDYLVHTEAHHTRIVGNRIHNAFEDLVKVSGNGSAGTGNVLIEGNIIHGSEREGIDTVRTWSTVVRHNRIYNVKRVGIMCKGGIRSVLIYGNHVHTATTNNNQGITLGGSTDAQWAYDPYGYEAYDSHGWSNLVTGPWAGALSLRGAKDSSFFNNTIVGAQTAIITQVGGKTSGGLGTLRWYWTADGPLPSGHNGDGYTVTGTPLNDNVAFYNNIIVAGDNATAYATKFESGSLLGSAATLTSDYNLYHGFPVSGSGQRLVRSGGIDKGLEASGIYGANPLFANNHDDLRLRAGSPAIDSGLTITGLTGFFNEPIETTRDFGGSTRTGAWERGAYHYQYGVGLPFTDDFETPWDVVEGTWSVVASGSRVYRQTTDTGNAVSRVGSGWTDQVVQATVTPISFNGSDRHVSLYARFADMDNHYYLQLRNSNVVQLRKKVAGVVTVLQSVPFTVTAGTSHTLRLEAIGTTLKGHVDGVLLVSASDAALAAGGAALGMFNATAEFDAVVVTETPTPDILHVEQFEDDIANDFGTSGGNWAVATEGTMVYRQSSTAVADAWAWYDTAWADQELSIDVKPLAFNGSNRHVSIYVRWIDSNNHYYLSLRSNHTIELKKKVGGVVTTLQSASFTVNTGTWYSLRLKASGSSLEAYIDDVLRLSATDTALASGTVALGTYAASASFADLLVTAP